jgi:transcriptional regulator with XRE-family HTH domain
MLYGVRPIGFSARRFLDLSAQEAAMVELKLALTEKFKKRRQKSRITQTELARMLRSSQSRVAKIEAGDRTVSLDLLLWAIFATGATLKEVGHYLTYVAESKMHKRVAESRNQTVEVLHFFARTLRFSCLNHRIHGIFQAVFDLEEANLAIFPTPKCTDSSKSHSMQNASGTDPWILGPSSW